MGMCTSGGEDIIQGMVGFRQKLLSTAAAYNMFGRGDRILVALSGGADSVALLDALYGISLAYGDIEVCAAHINHRIRGAESDRDEEFVRELCAKYGIDLSVGGYNVPEMARELSLGIEEAARNIRYRFLEESADLYGCSKIATAHNANDNAETLIFNLARGTGLRGLTGIPPVRGRIIRPLIDMSRPEIERYLEIRDIPHITDSTNADLSYTRNRIRHSVIPVLQSINPAFVEGTRDTSVLLTNDSIALDKLADEALGAHPESITKYDIRSLMGYTPSVASRIIMALNRNAGGKELTKRHIDLVLSIIKDKKPSSSVNLPSNVVAKREYGDIIFEQASINQPTSVPEGGEAIPLNLGETQFGSWIIKLELVEAEEAGKAGKASRAGSFIKSNLLDEGLYVRGRKAADAISPHGRNWTKTLKKMFIDMKIPRSEREGIPVVVCSGRVCAVPGVAPDKNFIAEGAPALAISFIKTSAKL